MGHIKVKTHGLRDILSEYVGESLIDEACEDVLRFIRDHVEVVMHVQKKAGEADLNLIIGDVVTIKYEIEIGLLLARDPASITEETVNETKRHRNSNFGLFGRVLRRSGSYKQGRAD